MKNIITRIMKSRIFSLIEILLFIAVCIGIGALAAFINHESNPTEQAIVYFRAFVQQDYDKMYSCLDVDGGYYINKNMYTESMKKVRSDMTIDSYEIEETEKVNGAKQITIKCINSQTGESKDFIIRFTARRKAFHLVPEYYVNIEDMFAKNFSVVMNEGDYLELNGEKVPDNSSEKSTDEMGNTVYTIKGILKGDYKVSATNKYAAIFKNVNIEKADTKVELTGTDYTANDKYTQLITENGENVINSFYNAVRKRKPDDKKLTAYFDNKKLIEKVKNYVLESQKIVYWPETENIDDYSVKEMNMSKFNKIIKYNAKKQRFEVVYDYNYDYVSSTDTALYTSYVYDLSGKCKSTVKFIYTIKKDNIVLTDMNMTNNNKKNGE